MTQASPHVLIAGAGPVGLVSALKLAQAGVKVTLLERAATLAEDLRASTFHPPTMDLLAQFGIMSRLIEQGLIARYTQQRDRTEGLVAEFDMELLKGVTDHPYRLQCEQWKLTRLLKEQLDKLPNAELLFNAVVKDVTQDDSSVTVTATVDGEERSFKGDYLIGADGARSTVRTVLGIDFEGFTYPERFLVVSTDFEYADHFPHLSYVNYVSDPEEWCVLLRVPALWRVLFPVPPEISDEELLSDESVQGRLQKLLPQPVPYKTIHRTLYNVHQRVAKEFRKGRVLLAGDSAHVNNPLGGMGMNGGVQDAFNVSEKLIDIFAGKSDESVLDRYERQRRQVAIEYINANTARNKKHIEETDAAARKKNHDELRAIAANPEAARDYLRKTSMIDALERAESIQ